MTSLLPGTSEPNTWIADRFRGLLIVMAVGYGVLMLLAGGLVLYMRYNRVEALRGDADAARKIILPAYQPLLLLLLAVCFVYVVYFCVALMVVKVSRASTRFETEVYYSGRLYVIVLVVAFMYQKSVSAPAVRRAALLSAVLATYNIPIVWYVAEYQSDEIAYWVPTFTRLLLLIFFIWVFINPPRRASKRTLREYCAFVFVYYAFLITYNELFHQGRVEEGLIVTYCNIFWASLCPLVMWRVLKADTEYWRGLGRRAVALQSLFRQRNNIHERISSRGLHVLIEMHRKYIIDFAYLELKQRIGVGASAVVFNGILHSKVPVAVKVYTPNELSEDTVAEFSHEAALCGSLHHPNIVKFYGMCVYPPTICLVSELCQGSLDDVTRAIARRTHELHRQQFAINLNYMIDAARAVAYLHSFSPAFLHRDIKPANFLVDSRCVVKLTDFGESRSVPRADGNAQRGSSSDLWPSLPASVDENGVANAMTVRGTADYMAPELIQGKAGTAMYGEAADVFSLAITLWDILHPLEEKYPETNNNHLKIFEAVLNGKRPSLESVQHPVLRKLLSDAWDARPERRPNTQYVVATLEKIQRESLLNVATTLSDAIVKKSNHDQVMSASNIQGASLENFFCGESLQQRQEELDMVASPEEAIRMGNALMTTGFMHHHRHALAFENCTEMYYFDQAMIDKLNAQLRSQGLARRGSRHRMGSANDERQEAELIHISHGFQPSSSGSGSHGSTIAGDDRSSVSSSASTIPNKRMSTPFEAAVCNCPKLAKGYGAANQSKKQRFKRHKKWMPSTQDGSVLTEKLLTNEFGTTGDSAFDEFDTPSRSNRENYEIPLVLSDGENDDEEVILEDQYRSVHAENAASYA